MQKRAVVHEQAIPQTVEGKAMDYGKQGANKSAKNMPRHKEHNEKGTDKNPYGKTGPKAELVARMKAASEAKKADKTKG
ncbi:MAG: hypothetical protein ACLGIP_17825 [Alphaproteobacteria bacterium]